MNAATLIIASTIAQSSRYAEIDLTMYDVSITPTNDSSVEGTETIIFTLVSGAQYTIGSGTATMNLYDDDTVKVSVAKQGSDPTEGGNGTFRITRSGSTSGNLTVNFATGGSATSGTDYT